MTFDLDASVPGLHRRAPRCARRSCPGCCRPGCRRARTSSRSLKEGGRGNTSRGISLVTRGLVVLPGRGHLRPADRIAAADAVDPQAADHRLRLRHRRHHVGADGADGRRLPDAGGAAGLLRSPGARAARRLRQFEAVALTNRFRMVFSGSGAIEIEGKDVQAEQRPPERQLRAGHRRLLRRHRPEAARGPDVQRGRPRLEAAGRHRERGVRAEALRQRERAGPAFPHGRRQHASRSAPGAPSSAW